MIVVRRYKDDTVSTMLTADGYPMPFENKDTALEFCRQFWTEDEIKNLRFEEPLDGELETPQQVEELEVVKL